MKQLVIRIVVGLAAVIAFFFLLKWLVGLLFGGSDHSELKRKGDSLAGAYGENAQDYRAVRATTDSALAGAGTLLMPRARAIVQGERKAAGKALGTSEKRVKNLTTQLSHAQPKLRVFGAIDYETPPGPVLEGTLAAKAGLALSVKQGLDLEVYGQIPLVGQDDRRTRLHVALRKDFRIF